MKKIIFAGVAVLMLAFTGCKGQGSNANNDLSAKQDSLATAFGKMFAYQFDQQQQMTPDSLRVDKAEFMKGLKVALAADTTNAGKSYLQGLNMGMQMLGQLDMLEKQYGINREKVVEAFKVALAADSVNVDPQALNSQMMSLASSIKEAKMADDPVAMANKKATEGYFNTLKKKGAKSLKNGLVYEVIEEGDGVKVNAGDQLNAIVTMYDKNGSEISSTHGEAVPIPASNFKDIHPLLAEGVTAMHVGSRYKFYINLGANVPQGSGMKPFDFVVYDIKLVPAPVKEEKEDAPAAPGK